MMRCYFVLIGGEQSAMKSHSKGDYGLDGVSGGRYSVVECEQSGVGSHSTKR